MTTAFVAIATESQDPNKAWNTIGNHKTTTISTAPIPAPVNVADLPNFYVAARGDTFNQSCGAFLYDDDDSNANYVMTTGLPSFAACVGYCDTVEKANCWVVPGSVEAQDAHFTMPTGLITFVAYDCVVKL